MQTNCCFHKNEPTHETSHSQNLFGSLLDNLDTETRARVLEQPCMKNPLVIAEGIYGKVMQKKLMSCSYFNAERGQFIRTKARGQGKLGPMGWDNGHGYTVISLSCSQQAIRVLQSHLVLLWFIGRLPGTHEQMDHISGNRADDRPDNLRLVSNTTNSRNREMQSNNTSGVTGVLWYARDGNWQSRIQVDGKMIHLGYFSTREDATIARQYYISTHPKLGFTARHGL